MSKSFLGKWLEDSIEATNEAYKMTGEAEIVKQEVQKKKKGGQIVYTKKGAPDYLGIKKGGISVAFDAKATKRPSFPLDTILKRPHQLEFLLRYDRLGGIGFYLIGFEKQHRFFTVPAATVQKAIRQAEQGGRRSIPIESIEEYEVFPSFQYSLDYLGTDKKRKHKLKLFTG